MAVQPLSPATDRRLGGPLPHQLSNQTRGHLSAHKALATRGCPLAALCGISSRFQLLSPTERQVPHALLTRPPLSHPLRLTEVALQGASFDLHVLGTPPAFVLSQDQTLYEWYLNDSEESIKSIHKFALSYTQEFSLAVLSRNVSTLTFQNNFVFQSKLSKVFVHVSRCLI